jgi:hypothetical protein
MSIFDDIKEYITDCVKSNRPHDTFAVDEEGFVRVMKESMITTAHGQQWTDDYLPVYSLSQRERDIPGIIGQYMGVNIVRKP